MAEIYTDIKPSFETLIQKFKNHGFHFTQFMNECEDSCLPVDAEWNLKDIAHVPFMHHHAIREFTYIGNNVYNTLDIQKVMGITIPQSTIFYSCVEDNKTITHTTLFFGVILIETSFQPIGELKTRTIARYAIGSKFILGRLLHPIIKFGVIRNWKRFNEDDRPVRSRKGALRQKGYTFDTQSPVDHLKTIDTSKNGIFILKEGSKSHQPKERRKLTLSKNMNKNILVGEDDHLGLQIKITPKVIRIFPRLCPHQGGSLDNCDLNVLSIACPWHGRKFTALCSIRHNGKQQTYSGPYHKVTYESDVLEIIFEASPKDNSDWTLPWILN